MLVDCNSKRLDVVVNEIVTKGHHIPLKIVADVTVAEDIDHIIDKTIEKFGKLSSFKMKSKLSISFFLIVHFFRKIGCLNQ